MIATLIPGDSGVGMAAVFGTVSNATRDFIADRTRTYAETLPVELRNLKTNLSDGVLDRLEAVTNSAFTHKVLALKNKLDYSWQSDVVRPHRTLASLQQATSSNMRWVMAAPSLRSYHKGDRIEGYGEDYKDARPEEGVGKDHYDYRRVMSGLYQENSNGEKVFIEYLERIVDPNDILALLEKSAILESWTTAEQALEKELDPTSQWNSRIS